jgi:peptidoglycan biosynthesis protein MviN/MurJ (putative lipid II flippase)
MEVEAAFQAVMVPEFPEFKHHTDHQATNKLISHAS